jgi:hypothetical protein
MKRIILPLLTLATGFLTTANLFAETEAPDSVSGMAIIVKMTAPKVETATAIFDDSTYTDIGGDNDYGAYTYTKTDASHCVLTLTQQEPGPDNGDVSTLDLAFKNNYSGNITGQVVFAGGGSKPLKGSFTFDITPPTLVITAPKANAKLTNGTFTVAGTARDNVGVSNVWWQVNSNGWQLATQVNNAWSNWTATATLVPGPDVLQAYAVDTSGNVSKTNTVKFNYILTAPLDVQIVGSGKVSPDDNGKLLDIGSSYALEAVAGKGFGFYYWSGTNVTMSSNPKLTFVMASNLTIIANFKDVAKPVAAITFPTANLKWSNTNITVTGKASDNVGVTGVGVQINNGGWMAADMGTGFTNWTAANLPVVFGTNIVQAYAVDAAGNVSPTNVVKFLGVLAPASLAGYKATALPAGSKKGIVITWSDDTWAQTGTGGDTNADDYCAGSYVYVQTGPNTAVLTNVDIGMMSWLGTTNVTTVSITFTSATGGSYSWSSANDSGSGAMTFSHMSNLVPASLGGRTVQFYNSNGSAAGLETLNNDGTFTQSKGGVVNGSGTYTVTQYSPTVAILQQNFTDVNDAGAVSFAELTFDSATAGQVFYSYYENPAYGGNPDKTELGTFKIQSVNTLAPSSLAGYKATAKPSAGKQGIVITWSDDTWAQTGTSGDTNADDYCAGSYVYVQTGPNTAMLTNVDIGMMSWLGTTNVTTVNITFTSATGGSYSWSSGNDSGSGTMTFSHVSNLVPATLGGRTVQVIANSKVLVTSTLANDGTFNSVEVNGDTHYGTYTLTQYSPTVAILQLIHTDPDEAGAVTYAEMTFTSATGGQVFNSYYGNPAYGSNPDEADLGTFKIK